MTSRKYPTRPWVSAHAIIFNKKQEILLTKRAASPKKNFWFPPGGVIDLGETVISGLKREIMEETNIRVTNFHFNDYIDGITYNKEGRILYHFIVFIFTSNYLDGEVEAKDDALEAKWFSIEDIISKIVLVTDEFIQITNRLANNTTLS